MAIRKKEQATMKIGILGTGDVGQALGNAFVALEYEVRMGSRDAANEKAQAWAAAAGPLASAGTFADATAFADIVVLATLGVANESAITMAGRDAFADKIVIDTTNPLDFAEGRPPALAVGHTDSGGEQVQRLLPAAKVVKAFNTVGSPFMFRPDFAGGPPTMFLCGNDAGAKATVSSLLADFGWAVADIGGIEGARHLEPMCMTWVLYGLTNGTWNHAFKLLTR
jgi:predicted dinucleotide-binding enzyme